MRTVQVNGYKHRYFEGKLTAWPPSKITIAQSTLGIMSGFSIRTTVPVMKLSPVKQPQIQSESSYCIIFILLLYQWAHLACQVYPSMQVLVLAVFLVHWCILFLCYLPVLWNLATREQISLLVWNWVLHVLQPKYILSSAIGS